MGQIAWQSPQLRCCEPRASHQCSDAELVSFSRGASAWRCLCPQQVRRPCRPVDHPPRLPSLPATPGRPVTHAHAESQAGDGTVHPFTDRQWAWGRWGQAPASSSSSSSSSSSTGCGWNARGNRSSRIRSHGWRRQWQCSAGQAGTQLSPQQEPSVLPPVLPSHRGGGRCSSRGEQPAPRLLPTCASKDCFRGDCLARCDGQLSRQASRGTGSTEQG